MKDESLLKLIQGMSGHLHNAKNGFLKKSKKMSTIVGFGREVMIKKEHHL